MAKIHGLWNGCCVRIRSSRSLRWGTVLAIIATIAILLALWRFKSQMEPEVGPVYRLHSVMGTLAEYYSSFGRFPPTTVCDSRGKPMYSWRGTVAAYLDNRPLSYIEELCVSQSVILPIDLYCWEKDAWGRQKSDTSVLAVTGTGTFFSQEAPRLNKDFVWDAIVLIQTADSGIHWLQPGDLNVDDPPVTLTKSIDDQGLHVVFLDGETWRLSRDVPDANLAVFFTLDGARTHDRDELLGPFVIEKYMQVTGTYPSLWKGVALRPGAWGAGHAGKP